MIESISMAKEASFGDAPQDVSALSKHNFFYGANGSGKTTISRVIADDTGYPDCQVKWKGGTKLEALVYNKDFVEKNFNQSTELKGIFTLGEKDDSVVTKIKVVKLEIEELNTKVEANKKVLSGEDGSGGKQAELKKHEDQFETKCWVFKIKYDQDFKDAFEGVRGKKTEFKSKLIYESKINNSDLVELEALKQRASTVFGPAPVKAEPIPTLGFEDLISLESSPILVKKIIGSADVDIAALIRQLGNNDWVKAGLEYLPLTKGTCPFCQQTLPETFEDQIAKYFDEAYEQDVNAIKQLSADYEECARVVSEDIQNIIDTDSAFIERDKLQSQKDVIDAKIAINRQRIHEKLKESSKVSSLVPLGAALQGVATIITAANTSIAAHNLTVANLAQEQSTLKKQVWKYVVNEASNDYAAYVAAKTILEKAIDGLTTSIQGKNAEKIKKSSELAKLEKSITSIKPTVDDINRLLSAYGFTGFLLAMADTEGYYKIIREDGKDAKETLSEGEKTFVTFLYFYHRLKGSETGSGMSGNRVVVFDDPVSSLDSEILFIVSSLIKGILVEVCDDSGPIKQVFVLTHNVYFHKEVTFNSKRGKEALKHETFWIVRKDNNQTQVEQHKDNPIKTSYELLWNELRSPGRSNLAIQNTLRRILENYFTILGNKNKDAIICGFIGKDRLVCQSLFSWINDGSHFASDDLYVTCDDTAIDKNLAIFKGIFKNEGHISHYNMMMGITGEAEPTLEVESDEEPTPVEAKS